MTRVMKKINQTPESVFPVNATEIAKKFGVLGNGDAGQIKDVLRGASRVRFVNLPEDTFPKGLPGKLVEAATRLEVVKQYSKLTTKQSEFVEGLIENIEALYGLMTEFPEMVKDTKGRVMKTAATGAVFVGLATACTGPINVNSNKTVLPTSSPIVKSTASEIPGFIPGNASNETSTEQNPYPSSLENLNATPSIFGSEAESKLAEYGLKEDLNAIKDWYRANGIKDENMVAVINEAGGTWNLMVKAEDGHFLKFTITNGLEAGQVVRDMGMIAYLNKEASTRFTTLEIPNPDGFENAVQKPIGAKSGWNIIGAFEGDTLVAWFDANTDNGGAWELLPNAATATPENSLLTGDLSGLAAAPDMTVDSAGLHITLPDSSRVMNVTTENVGKQVVFDSEYSLYKIYDANGNISAEYDPGQGKEGDVDYVPSTGWVDVQKLAKDLVCKKGNGVNCITSYSDSHVVDKSVWYETNSIGIFRYLEVKDPSTGENLGRVLLLQMASRNDLQNPITSWFLVQEEASYDPGVNRLNSVVQMVLVDTKDFSLYKKGELYDLSQWIGWMPKGSMWTFSFAKSGWDYTYLLKKNAPVSDDVSQDAIDFISSNGETSPEGGVILRANGSSGREAMK